MNLKARRVEKRIGDAWIPIEMKDVEEGDWIRAFDPDGQAVMQFGGLDGVEALSDAEIDEESTERFGEKIWGVFCEK